MCFLCPQAGLSTHTRIQQTATVSESSKVQLSHSPVALLIHQKTEGLLVEYWRSKESIETTI
jgi:hypothetical protein